MPSGQITAVTRLPSGLTRELFEHGDDLWKRLAPVWCALLESTGETSAFLSSSWIETWLASYGRRAHSRGVVWRDPEGEAVGCVLLSSGQGRVGPFRVSRAFLNASCAGGVLSEHNDVLVVPSHREVVLDDLVSVILGLRPDELALVGVRERLFEEIRARWPERYWNGYSSESPYIELDRVRAADGDYLSLLSSNTRSQIRRSVRLYEELFGPGNIEVGEGRDEIHAWLRDLIDLHDAVWEDRGETGAFGPSARRFHEALIDRVAGPEPASESDPTGRALSVDLVRVRFGAETVGMLYHLTHANRVHFYQSGFRYNGDGRFKPGLVTHCMSATSYAGRGLAEYDFLGGEPETVQYKRSLSTDKRRLYWAQLGAPTWKMRAIEWVRQAWRRYVAPEEEPSVS